MRSPEIGQDGKVTFRLAAPNATSVIARNSTGGFADWPGGNDVTLAKGEDGVWSATIGPLKPFGSHLRGGLVLPQALK